MKTDAPLHAGVPRDALHILAVSVCLALALLGTALNSRADFIREANGSLTTDLPGVTITALATPGVEAWKVAVSFAEWTAYGWPAYVEEPSSGPGVANALTFDLDGFVWTSHVALPPGTLALPSGTTVPWRNAAGTTVDVAFEDLTETTPPPPNGSVPDGGTSSIALVGCALAACLGLKKRLDR